MYVMKYVWWTLEHHKLLCLFVSYHGPLQQRAVTLICTRASPGPLIKWKECDIFHLSLKYISNCSCSMKYISNLSFCPSPLSLLVALQGAVTWHYDHFFPFTAPETKRIFNPGTNRQILQNTIYTERDIALLELFNCIGKLRASLFNQQKKTQMNARF